MEKSALVTRLTALRVDIAVHDKLIARQRKIVESLERSGDAAAIAKALLREFEQAQADRIHERNDISAWLAR
jgi:hypothetical protein